MKKLIKIILVIFISLILVFLFLFKLIFSHTYQEPYLNYSLSSFDYYKELAQQIDKQLLNITTGSKDILVSESLINQGINKELVNENYFESEIIIFQKTNTIKIDHLWVKINADYINLYGNVNLNNRYFSGIKLTFTITTDDDTIYLHLKKIKLGKLLILPQFFTFIMKGYIHEPFKLNNNTFIIPKQYFNDKISEKLYTKVIKIDKISLVVGYIHLSFYISLL